MTVLELSPIGRLREKSGETKMSHRVSIGVLIVAGLWGCASSPDPMHQLAFEGLHRSGEARFVSARQMRDEASPPPVVQVRTVVEPTSVAKPAPPASDPPAPSPVAVAETVAQRSPAIPVQASPTNDDVL